MLATFLHIILPSIVIVAQAAFTVSFSQPESVIIKFKPDANKDDIVAHYATVQMRHAMKLKSLSKRGMLGQNIPAGLKHNFTIGANFSGYTGHFDSETLNFIKNSNTVEYVQPNIRTSPQAVVTQHNASWELDRLSHRTLSASGPPFNYVYDDSTAGAGITVYIVDSGIATDDPEFEGRAITGKNMVTGATDEDVNGHGTMVAGIIGSKTFGVAKKANLVSVKISGPENAPDIVKVIPGIAWAVNDARGKRAVLVITEVAYKVNDPYNDAVKAAVDSGLVVVVAAGNTNSDAGGFSPGSEPSVLTVAATDMDDHRLNISNYGASVDIFAPGVNILTTALNNNSTVVGGTSAACAIVSGLAAYIWSCLPNASNKEIVGKILSSALKGVVKDAGEGSPNLLAYNLNGSPFSGLKP